MSRARRLLAAAIGLAAAVAAAVPCVIWWHRLPDPMATHWGFSGPPNGAGSRVAAMAALVGPAVVLGVASAVASLRGSRTAIFVGAVLAGIAANLAWASWMTVLANVDVRAWRDARSGGGLLTGLLGLAVGAVVAGTVTRLAPARAPAAGDAGAAAVSVGLRPGEYASWTGQARASWVLSASLAAGVLAVALGTRSLAAVLTPLVLLAIAIAFTSVQVSVDGRGLRVRYGPLPWPVTQIPLERIRRADAIDLKPLAWGGWGYRGSRKVLRRAAVVLRAGDAIRLDLTDGSEFAVTVDDAAAGAGLINDLRARAG